MSRISPTAEGFRAAFRRPLLTLGEITWRGVVGATATVLFFFGLFEFLNTLPVTSGELLFLRTRQPFLVSQAIAHILRGSLSRAVLSLTLAALLLAVIWMVAGTLGRLATVEAMIDYFRARFHDAAFEDDRSVIAGRLRSNQIFGLLRLNFLRVAVFIAALVGLVGATFLARSASSQPHPRPALALLIFVSTAGLTCFFAGALNWSLSLASIFVVRDGEDVIGAISGAVSLCRERTAPVVAVGIWTGIAHLVVFVGASTVVAVPLALAQVLPWRLAALGVLLVTLVYFAIADWLYTARLAGYVCIAEMPEALLAPPLPPVIPSPPLPSATVDRDELILSDVPQPVTG